MYQAAIFDLDGTVVDTVESIGHTMNLCLAGYGLPEQPIEKYRFFAGDGAHKLVARWKQREIRTLLWRNGRLKIIWNGSAQAACTVSAPFPD